MLAFLKKKVKAEDLGVVFFEHIKEAALTGQPKKIFPDESTIGLLNVKNEWLYLDAFSIDYEVFVALGNSAQRDAILRPFWRNMKNWLREEKVESLPERYWLIGDGGLKKIPPEDCETSWERLERRTAIFDEAARTAHRFGPSWTVAEAFAGLCGVLDSAFIMGVSTWLSTGKIERVKSIRSFRIEL